MTTRASLSSRVSRQSRRWPMTERKPMSTRVPPQQFIEQRRAAARPQSKLPDRAVGLDRESLSVRGVHGVVGADRQNSTKAAEREARRSTRRPPRSRIRTRNDRGRHDEDSGRWRGRKELPPCSAFPPRRWNRRSSSLVLKPPIRDGILTTDPSSFVQRLHDASPPARRRSAASAVIRPAISALRNPLTSASSRQACVRQTRARPHSSADRS
jgi:hypothetical protein